MHLVRRQTCRVCGSSALTPAVDLGEQHLQGSFVKPGLVVLTRRVSTALVRCDTARDERACGLLQMLHSVPPEVLYDTYWYKSGTNATMRGHLAELAAESLSLLGKRDRPVRVLDVGCNDGTLLAAFPDGTERFGVDPSGLPTVALPFGAKVVKDFFPSTKLTEALGGWGTCDVITSVAMFYDLEAPVKFVEEVRGHLASGGLWCVEVSYMPSMLAKTSYDTICHEHLEYYSLATLEGVVKRAGMRVVSASLNTCNGGSIRVYAARDDDNTHVVSPSVATLRLQEFGLELDTPGPYARFQECANVHRDKLGSLIRSLRADGKRVHVYGASTKGNTILQWCGLDGKLIDVAADRNPDKHGARTLGTDIPIVSEAESRAMKPDYYLVLPWHFRTEFLEREREALASGVKMIFPLPEVEVVG